MSNYQEKQDTPPLSAALAVLALAMVVVGCTALRPASEPTSSDGDALKFYDDNHDGRITCKEARRHGIAPVPRGHPAYRYMRDGDNDGVVCE